MATERNANSVPSLTAKSNAANNADVVLWADPATHALLISGSISAGTLTNNNAAPGAANQGVLPAVATAGVQSYTEGNQVLLSTDLTGALRVTGSLSVGGTTDNTAFTAGTSTGTTILGFYHATVDSVTDGRAAAVAITVKRAQHVSLFDATGNAMLGQKAMAASIPVVLASDQGSIPVAATLTAETTKVIGTVRVLGNAGAVVDGVNTAATAPANGVLGLGIFNTTEPSPTTGQSVGIQLDSKGRQRMVIMDAAGNTRGINVAATGNISVDTVTTVTTVSTVTAVTAITNALPAGTNLMGKVGLDQTTPGTTNGVALAQIGSTTTLAGNGVTGAGSLRVTLASDNSAIALWGHGATAAAVPANAVLGGGRGSTANPTAVTDGQMVAALRDKLGKAVVVGAIRDLKVNQVTTITSSTAETTILTAVASTFLDLYGIIITNTSATAVNVAIKDSTAGTTQLNVAVPAGETRGFMLPAGDGIKQGTVNNNWTATVSASVASVVITALAVKNI